jgi:hypothetical protein
MIIRNVKTTEQESQISKKIDAEEGREGCTTEKSAKIIPTSTNAIMVNCRSMNGLK